MRPMAIKTVRAKEEWEQRQPSAPRGKRESLTLVTEAKARELLMLGDGGLATQSSPASAVELGGRSISCCCRAASCSHHS